MNQWAVEHLDKEAYGVIQTCETELTTENITPKCVYTCVRIFLIGIFHQELIKPDFSAETFYSWYFGEIAGLLSIIYGMLNAKPKPSEGNNLLVGSK